MINLPGRPGRAVINLPAPPAMGMIHVNLV